MLARLFVFHALFLYDIGQVCVLSLPETGRSGGSDNLERQVCYLFEKIKKNNINEAVGLINYKTLSLG